MPIRDTARVAGSLQDVATLLALPADDCNVLLVSSRTLYLMANYAVSEVNFLGRYYLEEFGGGLVRTVESTDPEVPDILEVAQNYRLEVIPVTCDLVAELRSIASAVTGLQLAGCCPPSGENPPQPTTTEGQPPPPGYEEYDPIITDRKCKLANMAVDDLLAVIDLLIANDVTNIANLGLGAMSAMWAFIVGTIAAGPIAWGLAGLGAILSLVGFFLVNTLDLVMLKTLIENNRTDLVCALFRAGDNANAFAEFKEVLDDAGANPLDLLFLDTLGVLDGLTTLFFAPEGETGQAIESRLDGFVATTDCALCPELPQNWVIAPESNLLAFYETASGFLGTGTVQNDGSQFVITAEQITAGAGNIGDYVLMIATQAYIDAMAAQMTTTPNPSGSESGQYTRHDNVPAGLINAIGRHTVVPCSASVASPSIDPGPITENNFQAIRYLSTTPFSITFSIPSQPTVCP